MNSRSGMRISASVAHLTTSGQGMLPSISRAYYPGHDDPPSELFSTLRICLWDMRHGDRKRKAARLARQSAVSGSFCILFSFRFLPK